MKQTLKSYLIVGIILFGITRIYGLFAHGVISLAMESTAIVALLGGVFLALIKTSLNKKHPSSNWLVFTYNVALAFLINHLFIQGVLTIAGGSSSLDYLFISLSGVFALITIGLWGINLFAPRKESIKA
jgi:hypothetical protein